MIEEHSAIITHSPNLFGVLSRCNDIEISQKLEFYFALSIKYGGLDELDFKREDGASYNPRPARIALILINDAKIYSEEILCKAFLSTIGIKALNQNETKEIDTYLNDYNLITSNIDFILENNYSKELAAIALARHLDRIRHRHLAKENIDSINLINFIEETRKYLKLANFHSKELYTLIEFWLNRRDRLA